MAKKKATLVKQKQPLLGLGRGQSSRLERERARLENELKLKLEAEAKSNLSKEKDDDDERIFGGTSKQTDSTVKTKPAVLENFSVQIPVLGRITDEKIIHRKKETDELIKTILRIENNNILLIGEKGSGRKSIIEYIAIQSIKNTNLNFRNFSFYLLDITQLIAGARYKGQLEERLQAIINELKRDSKIVIVLEDFSRIINDDDYKTIVEKLSKIYNPLICIITNSEFEYLKTDHFLKDFKKIQIGCPELHTTREIILSKISFFEQKYSCIFNESHINEIIELSSLYIPNLAQPLNSIELMHEICSELRYNRFHGLQKEKKQLYDETLSEYDRIKREKNTVVKSQKYEEAARLRDSEKKIELKLSILISEFEKISERIKVEYDDIVNTLSNITSVSFEHIVNRQHIPKHNKDGGSNSHNSLPEFEISQTKSIFHSHEISILRGTGFVLLPHNEQFDTLFEEVIKPAMEVNGIICSKGNSIFQPGAILPQIWKEIRTSEVLIADVSGQNPNVIFELGLCYGIQRNPILLIQNPEELPFNLRNLRYLQYEENLKGITELKEKLTKTISAFLSAVRS